MEGPSFLGFYDAAIDARNNMQLSFSVRASANGLVSDGGQHSSVPGQDVRLTLAVALRSRIYRFRAERFNSGKYAFGASPALAPDAVNLPQVLDVLNGNPHRFDALNLLISEILPQVKRVSVRPIGPSEVQVVVWPHDHTTQREDLAIPLNECGSGVGQVLAILYLVMTSDHPQTILIDEPQSFLHPGAIRKLIDVLRRYPQHQYILATHSPTVISAADPSTLIMVRATNGESVLEVMDTTNAKHLQSYLAEIGARLADVFGADNILWVEGQTEEECFPLILRHSGRSLMGTMIVGIRQTGDLQGRDRRKVLEMYRKLSQARTLLPPPVAFIFDRECATQQQRDDLVRMGPGQVHFLPRRMYENYLLDPTAVAVVMNASEDFRELPVSEAEVGKFFESKCKEPKGPGQQLQYFCRGTNDAPTDWEREIDAARLLEAAFAELSENRVQYEKTTHSVAITEWLLANKPEALQEIVELLASLLPVH